MSKYWFSSAYKTGSSTYLARVYERDPIADTWTIKWTAPSVMVVSSDSWIQCLVDTRDGEYFGVVIGGNTVRLYVGTFAGGFTPYEIPNTNYVRGIYVGGPDNILLWLRDTSDDHGKLYHWNGSTFSVVLDLGLMGYGPYGTFLDGLQGIVACCGNTVGYNDVYVNTDGDLSNPASWSSVGPPGKQKAYNIFVTKAVSPSDYELHAGAHTGEAGVYAAYRYVPGGGWSGYATFSYFQSSKAFARRSDDDLRAHMETPERIGRYVAGSWTEQYTTPGGGLRYGHHIGNIDCTVFGGYGGFYHSIIIERRWGIDADWQSYASAVFDANLVIGSYRITSADPDTEPPYLQNQDPAPAAADRSRDTTVTLEIVDDLTGTDAASVVLTVAGVTAWTGDAQQAGFSVVKSVVTGGFRYVITPDTLFAYGQNVVIGVYATDVATNVLDTSYYFDVVDDTTGPFLQNLDPGSGDVDVERDVDIALEIIDTAAGVDESTVVLKVQGVTAWTGDAAQPGFTVTKSAVTDGFRYVIDPDTLLPSYTVITIGVYAEDLASTPNVLDTSYPFTTVITPPQVTPIDPLSYESNVDTTTDITLDVEAVDGNLNDAATVIQLNGVPVWMSDMSVHTDYPVTRTPLLKGWRFVINPVADLPSETEMTLAVHAENDYPTPAVSDVSYPFTTRTPPCVMFGAVPKLWGVLPWGYQPFCDPTCFTGPLNPTEEALLLEFSGLVNIEKLRRALVQYVVLPGGNEVEAARSIFLRAHTQEFAPTMFQIVPVPTAAEKAVRLCYKATDLAVSDNLRRKPNYIPGAITELAGLGLPYEHRKLFEAYAAEDQPSIEVPLACVIILLAKAFE